MKTDLRKFQTPEGRTVELVGAPASVQVWIDGKLHRTVAGVYAARRIAVDYSRRHAKEQK